MKKPHLRASYFFGDLRGTHRLDRARPALRGRSRTRLSACSNSELSATQVSFVALLNALVILL